MTIAAAPNGAAAVEDPSYGYSLGQERRQSVVRVYNRSTSETVSSEDVLSWTKAGARDDVIIDRIERSDAIFRLTAGDEMRLRQQGVSEDVIYAMKQTCRR